jgi:ketosteroid isomerase-like protein
MYKSISMKRYACFFVAIAMLSGSIHAQSKDETAVRQMLAQQDKAWNRGDIEGFMQGYWHNDSLMFIGKSGITYGWQNTLDNYKKGYPDTTTMGKLAFNYIEIKRLSVNYFFVVGRWHLTRTIGNLDGAFTLLIKRIKNRWLIIKDHSS